VLVPATLHGLPENTRCIGDHAAIATTRAGRYVYTPASPYRHPSTTCPGRSDPFRT